MLTAKNFAVDASGDEPDSQRQTIVAWLYQFLDACPEIDDCRERLVLALVRESGRQLSLDEEEESDDIETMCRSLTPEILHDIWIRDVLGLDSCTGQPI